MGQWKKKKRRHSTRHIVNNFVINRYILYDLAMLMCWLCPLHHSGRHNTQKHTVYINRDKVHIYIYECV
jgi:hypothetical protein